MSSNYSGNNSAVGTGTHTEKRYDTGQVNKKKKLRRTKYRCIYFEKETRDCTELRIQCVGPSNPLCAGYCDNERQRKFHVDIRTGILIHDWKMGDGVIVEATSADFTVQFVKSDCQKKYSVKDIKSTKNGTIYI